MNSLLFRWFILCWMYIVSMLLVVSFWVMFWWFRKCIVIWLVWVMLVKMFGIDR